MKYTIRLRNLILSVCMVAFLLSACRPGHSRPETSGQDSVYTSGYIEKYIIGCWNTEKIKGNGSATTIGGIVRRTANSAGLLSCFNDKSI